MYNPSFAFHTINNKQVFQSLQWSHKSSERGSKPDTYAICILKDKAWITKQACRFWKLSVYTFVIRMEI